MATKNGRIGSSVANIEQQRRQVLKPLLDNPFTQTSWPEVGQDTLKGITDILIQILQSVSKYNRLKGKNLQATIHKPSVVDKMTIGFNSTTKSLEYKVQKRKKEWKLSFDNCKKINLNKKTVKDISYVFVCKDDIKPDILTQHFPSLCLMASGTDDEIKLVALPKGSVAQLSEALNAPNTTILGFPREFDESHLLNRLMENVEQPKVPWLSTMPKYEPLSVSFLQTTQPISRKVNQKDNNNDRKRENDQSGVRNQKKIKT
ncbi:BA75_00892T0 [Komagataella pastoris]|uniref:BA75_00892T0 n=1 Tax=Komagataella pastoris TaxID=4922 RepID=A0A1B2J8Y6_PICPA|nr:BA75_00892T0 [Komagataella pastoris]